MKNLKIISILLITLLIASCSKDDAAQATTANLSISSINPVSGPKNTTVLITGVNFSPNAISNIVTLNGKVCTVNSANATSLNITIPRGAGSGSISVTVAGSTAQTPNFEYIITPSMVSTFVGSTVGFADGTGAAAKLSYPSNIAFDASGNMYVADSGNYKIRKVSPAGVVTTLAGSIQGFADGSGAAAQFDYIAGIAVDASGNIYATDKGNHKIRKISSTGLVTTLAGSTSGFADGNGTSAQFNTPNGIALDNAGNVYVADLSNHKIRKISAAGVVTTLAGSTAGFSDGLGTAAKFNLPYGLAVDNSGNVYVADTGNTKIRKISPIGLVSTIAGSTQGFADGTGTAAQFSEPYDVDFDAIGNIYIADMSNNKIRKISQTGVVTTVAGSTVGFADGAATGAQFNLPFGLAVDVSGDVYVADRNNHKIRKITQD